MKKLTKLFVSLFVISVLALSMSACAKSVMVTFDANGGIVSPITSKMQTDKDYELPTPIKTGYNFVKWQHEGQDIAMKGVWEIEKDVTLKAVWEAKSYSVTLKYTDDEGEKTQTIDVVFGEEVELYKPTKEGYLFDGWYYENKLVLDGPWQVDGENIVLEAKWKSDTITVTFDLNGGAFPYPYEDLKQITLKYGQNYNLSIYGAYNKNGDRNPTWKVNGEAIDTIGIWLFTENVTVVANWAEFNPPR